MGAVVLLVDDDEVVRDLLGMALEDAGFQVLHAPEGDAALRLLGDQHVDLVLLDMRMPGKSGLEVLAELRRRHSAVQLPVLMVSAADDSAGVVEALNAGANDYVTKPVDLKVTLARVQGQLARRRESQPLPVQLQPGARFLHYDVQERLGQGSVGTVYRAVDTRLERSVALKVLSPAATSDPEQVERFSREARALARVRHPNVIGVFDFGSTPVPFLVMELVEGGSLEVAMGVRWQVGRAVAAARAVAQGLAACHAEGILHRDLKPSNILLDRRGGVRLTDFGLAKRLTDVDVHLTRTGAIVGTPQYMAPEQLDAALGPVGVRTDLHALGLILYELLTGQLAMQGESLAHMLYEILHRRPARPSAIVDGLPPALDELCLALQAREPSARPATAEQVDEILATCPTPRT